MNYYEVLPATNAYHGKTALTYCSKKNLKIGQILHVPLRNLNVIAVVVRKVTKPDFSVSSIGEILDDLLLDDTHLKLLDWLINYYPGSLGTTTRLFLPSYLGNYKNNQSPDDKKSLEKIVSSDPKLTKEQETAYKKISQTNSNKTFIINGVTGSGKTRLYIELLIDTVNSGKSALVLTPEIALTAPLASQIKDVFQEIVLINHSNLTPKQKLAIYQHVHESQTPKIIIGPRSTLFLPLKNIGLIVQDEFHESAYKQESAPYYYANRVSSKLASLSNAKLVYGSATPPLNDYYIAEQKKATIINLNTSAITNKKPKINKLVVDLSNKDEQSSYSLISNTLIKEIRKTLDRGEQIMVFINKRGSYRSILCKNCGWQTMCDNCDLPLVYHADKHIALCHTCGFKSKVPSACPDCDSIDLLFTSPGTKAVTSSLTSLFPKAKISRYDKDNKKHERFGANFEDISNGSIDIIVGTQVITKGFDLPKLSLVVMLITESSLNFPDYSSNEKTYQLIKQFSGRVNRGHREGKIILQTFKPNGEVLSFAEKPWIEFYKTEVEKRKKLGFPPYNYALKVQLSNKDRSKVEEKLQTVTEKIGNEYPKIKVLGPSPCFIEKKQGKFNWQIIIKSKDRRDLVKIVDTLPSSYTKDLDPVNFL